jgi:hypothetical protein
MPGIVIHPNPILLSFLPTTLVTAIWAFLDTRPLKRQTRIKWQWKARNGPTFMWLLLFAHPAVQVCSQEDCPFVRACAAIKEEGIDENTPEIIAEIRKVLEEHLAGIEPVDVNFIFFAPVLLFPVAAGIALQPVFIVSEHIFSGFTDFINQRFHMRVGLVANGF